jgi:hypothetical protein
MRLTLPVTRHQSIHLEDTLTPCSSGLSATNQRRFSLKTNQPPSSTTFLSEQIRTRHLTSARQTGC